jgi:hypothetical protein
MDLGWEFSKPIGIASLGVESGRLFPQQPANIMLFSGETEFFGWDKLTELFISPSPG